MKLHHVTLGSHSIVIALFILYCCIPGGESTEVCRLGEIEELIHGDQKTLLKYFQGLHKILRSVKCRGPLEELFTFDLKPNLSLIAIKQSGTNKTNSYLIVNGQEKCEIDVNRIFDDYVSSITNIPCDYIDYAFPDDSLIAAPILIYSLLVASIILVLLAIYAIYLTRNRPERISYPISSTEIKTLPNSTENKPVPSPVETKGLHLPINENLVQARSPGPMSEYFAPAKKKRPSKRSRSSKNSKKKQSVVNDD